MKLIFMGEERSMKCLLEGVLPKILPQGVSYQLIPHRGKQDLRRSIPNKLRAWNEPGEVAFIIVQDQDNKDCIALKKEILELYRPSHKKVLVRVACQELESWYFGDLPALEKAYRGKKLASLAPKSKYRTPDAIPNPKEELRKLIPEHEQIQGAKKIAPFMDIENNTSVSFQFFVSGVKRMAGC